MAVSYREKYKARLIVFVLKKTNEIAEGEAAIFQPDGNGRFTLVARISSE